MSSDGKTMECREFVHLLANISDHVGTDTATSIAAVTIYDNIRRAVPEIAAQGIPEELPLALIALSASGSMAQTKFIKCIAAGGRYSECLITAFSMLQCLISAALYTYVENAKILYMIMKEKNLQPKDLETLLEEYKRILTSGEANKIIEENFKTIDECMQDAASMIKTLGRQLHYIDEMFDKLDEKLEDIDSYTRFVGITIYAVLRYLIRAMEECDNKEGCVTRIAEQQACLSQAFNDVATAQLYAEKIKRGEMKTEDLMRMFKP